MRRAKTLTFEALAELAASLPWWLGLGLALLAYLGFHYLAAPPASSQPHNATDLARMAVGQMGAVLATILQYLVPIAFLVGAGVSAHRRRRASQLHDQVALAPHQQTLAGLSWQQFEVLIGEVFRRMGYQVVERGGGRPDGGVDLELHMGNDKYLVQCKHYRASSVGVGAVRELFGVMTAEGAVGGFVVCAGKFTKDAHRFAEGRAIHLHPASSVLKLIAGKGNGAASNGAEGVPACPACGVAMVLRRPRQRPDLPFWGCPKFPECRGTRDV